MRYFNKITKKFIMKIPSGYLLGNFKNRRERFIFARLKGILNTSYESWNCRTAKRWKINSF